jgi:hypothetical protein
VALPGVNLAGAAINNGALDVTLSGGGVLSYAVSGSLTNTDLKVVTGTSGSVTLYDLASPSVSPATLNLGAARVGDAALSGSISVSNVNLASPYQENLLYGLSSGQGALSFSNGSGTISAGGSIMPGITLSTATAGNFTGSTVSVSLTSTGAGTSGAGNTVLAGQTITVNGEIFAAAIAQLGTTTLNFGVVHAGGSVLENLMLTNAGMGALVDLLTGGTDMLSGYSGSVDFSAIGSGLAAGSEANLVFDILTASSGVINGDAVLGFLSHDSLLADLAINGGTVAITGTVDNYATAEIEKVGGSGTLTQNGNNFVLNLGTVAQGGHGITIDLGVLNAALGLADLLSGSFSISGSSAFTNTGFGPFSGLGAGQDEEAQVISLSTSATGIFTETIVLTSAGSNSSGYSGALATETLTVTGTVAVSGKTYKLTTGMDTVHGGTGYNIVEAATNTLSSGDQIDGGSSGHNTLELTGSGTFDLTAPATLTDLQTLTVTEGGGKGGSTVYLRSGLNLAVDVTAGGHGSITFHGASDSDVYRLGAGTDTVVLGSTAETVEGTGGGTAVAQATAATAGALVQGGGAGSTTLQISGGGSAVLNNADTDLTVQLLSAANLMLGGGSFITAVGSSGADTLTAGAANQVLTGGAGADTLVGSTSFATLFSDKSSGLNGDTIVNFGGASLVDLTDMSSSLLQPLKIKVTGSGAGAVSALTVTDGTHKATIDFAGTYALGNFNPMNDGHGGTQLAYVPGG